MNPFPVLGWLVFVVAGLWVCVSGYLSLKCKGLVVSLLGLGLLLLIVRRLLDSAASTTLQPGLTIQQRLQRLWSTIAYNFRHEYPLLWGAPFLLITALFLLLFPDSDFLQAVGLAPGVLLIGILALLLRGLRGDSMIASLGAIFLWCVVVWLWAESGREGFVVVSMDVPAGAEKADKRNAPEFTGDGIANALETEIEYFGSGEYGNYADTEAAQILAGDILPRLFPTNPWYKSPGTHAPQLTGLQTSHVIANTQVHGLPLAGIYHVLRHLRGKPLIEGQVLIGDDGSLTLALRRSNYELPCMSANLSRELKAAMAQDATDHASSDGSKIERLMWTVRHDRANQPDTAGCDPGSFWKFLSVIDLIPISALSQEERIANVTVSGVNGDAGITEALRFATLQAMAALSPERLALYYDNAAKYESALKYFEDALPELIWEYDEASADVKRTVQPRLLEALIRIGDLESELKDGGQMLSKGAYALAKEIAHDDPWVLSRIGYHYLVLAQLKSMEIELELKGGEWSALKCADYAQLEHYYREAKTTFETATNQFGP